MRTYDCALCGGVAPRLVVTREDSQVAAADELLVVHAQDRVVAVEEVGVEDDLDAVMRVVEELHAPDLGQNRVVVVVRHVVRRDGRERVPLKREDTALEQHLVLFREQIVRCGERGVFSVFPMRRLFDN